MGGRHRKTGWLIAVPVGIALLALFLAVRSHLTETTADALPQGGTEPRDRPSESPAAGTGVVAVQVVTPQRRDMAYAVTLPGTIAPFAQTTIYAKVAGYVKALHGDKGDLVKKGQLLAVIDDPELNAQYQKAASDYAIKQLTYERLSNVWKRNPNVVAKQDVDVAQATAEGARGSMEQLKAMLQYVQIRAPFSGVITARFVDAGTLVQAATASATAATPLFTLMDIDTVRVYVNVPQADVPFVKEGTPVTVTINEYPGTTYQASVTRSTVALDATTRTMLVESHILNPGHVLRPGMFAYATLALARHHGALALPAQTVLHEAAGTFVLTIEQGKAKKRPIKTGIQAGGWTEIREGLTGQEEVVVLGKTRVAEGHPVSPSPYSLPAGRPSAQPR